MARALPFNGSMGQLTRIRAQMGAEFRALRDGRRAELCHRHPVVLLHGWGGWSRQLLCLQQDLQRRLGRRVVRLGYGRSLDCIRSCAERAGEQVAEIACRDGVEAADVVGHSMGGLVATELLKSVDRGRWLRSVVTLGTPHRGSPWARAGAAVLGRVSPSLEQMLPGGEFLQDLGTRAVPSGSELFSVAGTADLLVPPRYAALPRRAGCHNLVLLGVDHWGLVVDRAAHELTGVLLRYRPGTAGKASDSRCDRCRSRLARELHVACDRAEPRWSEHEDQHHVVGMSSPPRANHPRAV
jgi:pimeloyl-ACP methyl ester carboxylesterase